MRTFQTRMGTSLKPLASCFLSTFLFVLVALGFLAVGATFAAAATTTGPAANSCTQVASMAPLASPPITRPRSAGLAERVSARPTDTVVLLDMSGSTYGPDGTDPHGDRFRAVQSLTNILASSSAPIPNRMGLILFGSDAPASVASQLVALPDHTGTLDAILSHRAPMGNTNFAAAINRASAILANSDPSRALHVVIVTDGLPDLGDGQASEKLMPTIVGALRHLPRSTSVHLMLVGDDVTWTHARQLWATADVTTIDRLNTNLDLMARYLDLAAADLGLTRLALERLDRPGDVMVNVPPLTESLIVTALPESQDAVAHWTIVDPDGATMATGPLAASANTLTVSTPTPGGWTLHAVPAGSLLVERRPLQIRLDDVDADAPQGRLIRIAASLQTAAGYRVADPPADTPNQMTIRVTFPDGSAETLRLRRVSSDRWLATRLLSTNYIGRYRVVGTDPSTAFAPSVLDVRARPYLAVNPPTQFLHDRVPIAVVADIDMSGHRRSIPRAVAYAELVDGAGRVIERITLHENNASNAFTGTFATRPEDGCSYALNAVLRTPTGDIDQWSGPTLQVRASSHPHAPDAWLAGVAVAAAMALGLGVAIRRRSATKSA
jgi:Mg-chelatase subunit ChlD